MLASSEDYNALLRELNAALRGGEADLGPGVLDQLINWVLDALIVGDPRVIAVRRAQIERLDRELSRPEASGNSTPDPRTVVSVARRMLARAAPAALSREVAAQAEEQAATVRDQVLALLETDAGRPSKIAARIRCDPAQVSRALQELVASGQVVRVPAPPGQTTDRRAFWYRAVDSSAGRGAISPTKEALLGRVFRDLESPTSRGVQRESVPFDAGRMEQIIADAPETRAELSIDDVVARLRAHQPGRSNAEAKLPAREAVPQLLGGERE